MVDWMDGWSNGWMDSWTDGWLDMDVHSFLQRII